MSRKILITGAAGFIGSQLAYRLHKMGDDVTLVDDFSYGREDNLVFPDCDFRNSVIRVDIRDAGKMDGIFAYGQFDAVCHFAGITPLPDCQSRPVDAADVNVRGTVMVLDLVRRYGVKKMVFASTSAVYENCRVFPSVEGDVVPPSLIYPSTKYAAEQFCRAFSDAYGIPVVCLRFANVYGPHVDCLRTQPPVMGYIIRELHAGRRPVMHADGRQQRDFVYVDDLTDLAVRVLDAEKFDIVNVSTGRTVSINDIYGMIASCMDSGIMPEYAPVDHYWHNYPDLYGGPYPIADRLLEGEVLKYTCLSNEHAKAAYGWEPKTQMPDGIRATVEFSVRALDGRTDG